MVPPATTATHKAKTASVALDSWQNQTLLPSSLQKVFQSIAASSLKVWAFPQSRRHSVLVENTAGWELEHGSLGLAVTQTRKHLSNELQSFKSFGAGGKDHIYNSNAVSVTTVTLQRWITTAFDNWESERSMEAAIWHAAFFSPQQSTDKAELLSLTFITDIYSSNWVASKWHIIMKQIKNSVICKN